MYNVFVYGTLKKGFSNHWYLENSKYLGIGKTIPKYQMYPSKNYFFPFLLKSEPNNNIVGEIYEVDEKTLIDLNILEDFPKMYLRELIEIKLENNEIIKAYIFYKNEENYKNLILKEKINEWN